MNSPSTLHILALDIGTSGIRASVYDEQGRELPDLKRKAPTPFANKGITEPEARDLLAAVREVLDASNAALTDAGISPEFGAISCFWHSLLGVDSKGSPVTSVLTWADTRPAPFVPRLREIADEREVHNRTGCHFHASYWPAKLLFLRETEPEAFSSADKWISFSDLVWRDITGELVSSVSIASGTGIYDIRANKWDLELAGELGLGSGSFPAVLAGGTQVTTGGEASSRWPAFAGTRWIPPIADGAANNVGAGCVGRGRAALMIGTSGALRMVYEGTVPDRIPEGVFCYRLDEKTICLGGALSNGGSLRRWLNEQLGIEVTEEQILDRLEERGADAHGLSLLPFVFGERSTGYHGDAEGAVIGLTRGSDAVDLSIAAMESVAYRFSDILARLEEVDPVEEITGSGGSLESSPAWQRIIADVLGRNLEITTSGGVSRLGAALYGLKAAGVFEGSSSPEPKQTNTVIHDPVAHLRYAEGEARHERFYARMLP